ncbi:hypothetical protein Fmac_020607 [Flemingia macrophylla]|uniref:Uncharacterized protein n=1 Tax=Flemingia macrophylla TaxID=520843 RepID=A0ABD1LUG3_9FABA
MSDLPLRVVHEVVEELCDGVNNRRVEVEATFGNGDGIVSVAIHALPRLVRVE